MKNLKFLFAVFAISLTLAFCSCADGCGGTKDPKPDVDPLPEITELIIDEETADIVLGEVLSIRATDGKNSVKCKWESSDESVASVNEWGDVTALNLGTAKITASYGKFSADCDVTVTLGGNLPALSVAADETVTVDLIHEAYIGGEIRFNGKTVSDGSVSYRVADESIGKIENGVFKPLKKGTTSITVSGEWKNIESDFLTKEISVNVIDNVCLLFGGEAVPKTIDIYATPEFAGKTFKNEAVIAPTLLLNGIEKEVSVSIDDQTVAEYDETSGKLIGLKGGSAVLRIDCTDGEFEFLQEVEVKVEAPVAEYAEKVKFSTFKGKIENDDGEDVLASLFPDGYNAAYSGENELEVAEGKILGVKGSKSGITQVSLTVKSEKYGYEFVADCCGLFVRTPEDLLAMKLTEKTLTTEGYVVLENDIDMTDFDINGDGQTGATGGNTHLDTFYPSYVGGKITSEAMFGGDGFTGVFDGNGHKINNFHMGNSYGFFGKMTGATICNVAFTDADVYLQGTFGMLFAKYASNVKINNVYVSFNIPDVSDSLYNRTSNFVLFGCADYVNISFENFIFETNNTFTKAATGIEGQCVGFFAKTDYTRYYANQTTMPGYLMRFSIKSVYMIAPRTANGRVMPINQSTQASVYASNDFAEIAEAAAVSLNATTLNPELNASGGMKLYHWANAYRYDSYEQMKEKTPKVGNWDVTSGAPVWVG